MAQHRAEKVKINRNCIFICRQKKTPKNKKIVFSGTHNENEFRSASSLVGLYMVLLWNEQNTVTVNLHLFSLSYIQSTGWPTKFGTLIVRLITSWNVGQCSNFLHCRNQEKICNNTITKMIAPHQMCCYTILWNASVSQKQQLKTTGLLKRHILSASSSRKADILNICCWMWQLL